MAIPDKSLVSGFDARMVGPVDAAEVCVFLHGWGGCKDLWLQTGDSLSDTIRGIALNLPGTGSAPLPDDLRQMSDLAQWVHDACERFKVDKVTLVGHSLGGNLAAQVALNYPALVGRLILVDAALEPGTFPWRSRVPLSPHYGLAALRLMRLASLPLAMAGRNVPHHHQGGNWRPMARRIRLYTETSQDKALQVQLRALCDNPISIADLQRLTIPLLMIHGEHDPMIPVAHARSVAEQVPGARLIIFETAQHCPMDTDPPRFARAIRQFIATTTG